MANIILILFAVFVVIALINSITGKLSTVSIILGTIINWGMVITMSIASAFALIQSESFYDFIMALFGFILGIIMIIAFISSAKEVRQKKEERKEKTLEENRKQVQAEEAPKNEATKAPADVIEQKPSKVIEQKPKKVIDQSEALEKREQALKNIQILYAELGAPSELIRPDLFDQFREHVNYLLENVEPNRIINATTTVLEIEGLKPDPENLLSAIIHSGENHYKTSLRTCKCPDFENHHKPCKHMIFLAHAVGVFETIPEEAFKEAPKEKGETK